MSEGFSNSTVGGVGNLIRSWIQSVPFVSGVSGWRISKNGSAEFNNVVIRNGTIVSGTQLEYDGTPASGNLLLSISATAGIDQFGNSYVKGFALYKTNAGGTSNVEIAFGSFGAAIRAFIAFTTGNVNQAHGFQISNTFVGSAATYNEIAYMLGPDTAGDTSQVALKLWSGQFNSALKAFGQFAYFKDPGFFGSGSEFDMGGWDYTGFSYIGNGVAVLPGTGTIASPAVAETWHNPAFGAGWAAGDSSGTLRGLRYRLQPDGSVWLYGAVHSTSATPNATMLTLSSGYFDPTTSQRISLASQAALTFTQDFATIGTTGLVQLVTNAAAVNVNYYFDNMIVTS